jgi:hypothetical protein
MSSKHEQKPCPRCGASFECKVGNVVLCQCASVELSPEEQAWIQARYDDCLCAACMKALQQEHHAEMIGEWHRRWQASQKAHTPEA